MKLTWEQLHCSRYGEIKCKNKNCKRPLQYHDGDDIIFEDYYYCPICNDIMYDDEGNYKGRLI